MASNLTETLFSTKYKDDFRDSDHYHKVLFNSGRVLQARELTQLQTILQKQIERFGTNIFKEGGAGPWKVEGEVFDEKEGLGRPAYSYVDLDVKVYLLRLQKTYGSQFTIEKGWLSKEYVKENSEKYNNDDSHLSGLVIDIKNEFNNDIDLFTERAFAAGFKHVVVYNKHIHLDIRDIPR